MVNVGTDEQLPMGPQVLVGQDLIAFLDGMERQGMQTVQQWTEAWQENLRYFFGEQLAGRGNFENWDWVVVNYIWPAAMQEIAKLARHDPAIIAEPYDANDAEAAAVWEGILQWIANTSLNEHGIRIEQIYANLDKKLFGYCVYKVLWEDQHHWDQQQQLWIGEVEGKLWNPANFWALDRENIYKGAIGTVRYVELTHAQAMWPQFREELAEKASSRQEDLGTGGTETIRGQRATSGTYPATGYGGQDKSTTGRLLSNRILDLVEGIDSYTGPLADIKWVKIQETWWYDRTTEHITQTEQVPLEELVATGQTQKVGLGWANPATGEPLTQQTWPSRVIADYDRPIFPNGRWVIRCDDLILNPDLELQKYPYQRWQFVVCPHYVLPHMWQGMDAVQLYRSTQDMINVTASHLVNNMKQFGDPKIAIERDAIDVPKGRDKAHYSIGKGAGRIIRLVKGGLKHIKVLDPPAPSPIVSQLYALFAQEFKNIVGLQDIAVGKAAKNMTATEASALVVSANDRILLQSVFEEAWLQNVMRMSGEIAKIHYEVGRYVRLIGQDKQAGIIQITQGLKDLRYDVKIRIGSTLPFDEEKRLIKFQQAYAATKDPMPGPMLPELLEVLDIPNWQKILSRTAMWQQFLKYQQLLEAVSAGQILPELALRVLASQLKPPMREPQQGPTGQNQIQGAQNAS